MSAVISDCGTYRYTLSRDIDEAVNGRRVCFVGVNPSTADATIDDATVRKWTGFARRWGCGSFVVVNLFAFRATNVSALAATPHPVGDWNNHYTMEAFATSNVIVPCWGSREKLPASLHHRIGYVRDKLRQSKRRIKVFGLTNSRDPKHPLMLSYATQLQEWTP